MDSFALERMVDKNSPNTPKSWMGARLIPHRLVLEVVVGALTIPRDLQTIEKLDWTLQIYIHASNTSRSQSVYGSIGHGHCVGCSFLTLTDG